jgi:Protein of unknown function (DUF1573)
MSYKRFFVILSILTSISCFIVWKTRSFARKESRPILGLNKDFQDWGKIPPGTNLSTTFAISNLGSQKLVLESVIASCGCTVPTLNLRELAPGETTDLSVTFQLPLTLGNIHHTINIVTNDPMNKSRTIHLNVISWTGIFTEPELLKFECPPIDSNNQTNTNSVTLLSKENKQFKITYIKNRNPELFSMEYDPNLMSTLHRIHVSYRGTIPKGIVSSSLQISTDREDCPLLEVPLIVTIRGAYAISPPALSMELSDLGTKFTKTIVLSKNIDKSGEVIDAPLIVKSVSLSSNFQISLEGYKVVSEGKNLVVFLNFNSEKSNALPLGSIKILLADPDHSEIHVPISARGWGPSFF